MSKLFKGLMFLIPLLYVLDVIKYGPFEGLLCVMTMGSMQFPPAHEVTGFAIRCVSFVMYAAIFRLLYLLNEWEIQIDTCGGWEAWVLKREDAFWETLKQCGELAGICGSGEKCSIVETTEGFYRIYDHIDEVKKGIPVYANSSTLVIGERGSHTCYPRYSE
ncbi:hypothetical protein ACYPKM_05045 [Pseudomonas aeruginosa]